MKYARFLVVALVALWGVGGCSSYLSLQRTKHIFHLRGSVVDSLTRQPVSGVRVWGESKQANKYPYTQSSQTDLNGHFELRMPVGRRGITGLISVSTIMYWGQAAVPIDTTQPVTLLLKRNAFRFKPYGCQQLADSARIAPYAAASIEGSPGSQHAFLIRDTTIHQPRKLRTVSFRMGHNAFPREPFQIRIYRYKDHREEPPGEDLLLESIMVCPVKEGMITYDVSSYDIIVAGSGFYLALEPILGSDKFYCADSTVAYKPTGPILRPPCARPDIRTWEYITGKGWRRATAVENCWPLFENALSVEVEPASTPPSGR